MKLTTLFVLGLLVVSTQALAQAPANEIEKALLAAPARARADATVIKWNPADQTYTTLKQGTSRMVCYDRSGFPLERAFSVECTSVANLDRVAQNLKFEASGDRDTRNEMVEAAEKDGSRVKPEYGSIFYNYRGDTMEQATRHTTIAVPGATAASTGLPDTRDQGFAWVMQAGTTSAHIMVPGR